MKHVEQLNFSLPPARARALSLSLSLSLCACRLAPKLILGDGDCHLATRTVIAPLGLVSYMILL